MERKNKELAEVRQYLKLWGDLWMTDKNVWIKSAIRQLMARETELRGVVL